MLARRAAGGSDEAIGTLLRRWLPGRLVAFTRADTGGSTPVYRVTAGPDHRVYFLRLAEEPGEQRAAEVRVHQTLAARGLPVPHVVAWEPAPPGLDRSAALTTAISGRPIGDCAGLDAAGIEAVARDAGRDLARINRLPVRGFGWVTDVDPADGSLTAEHPTRAVWAAEYAGALPTVVASGLLPDQANDRLRAALRRWLDQPDRTDSHLAHGDFDATHIYVKEPSGAYTGIIDFGEIRGADPLYDLGHALLQDQHCNAPSLFPGLLAGYAAVTPLPADPLPAIREQAAAIGVRQFAIFLRRQDRDGSARLAQQLASVLAMRSVR